MNNHKIPVVIPNAEHPISRDQINASALKVLNGLKAAGYASFLVGGCVRDLMLGREPKDFDVVTDARPEEVRELFRNSRLIGRRFQLVHVRFGREIIEVATFRAAPVEAGEDSSQQLSDEGRILRDNVFGNQEEDARRRDFTVNALYFDATDFSIVDYVCGVDDLKQGLLRVIGDPEQRYREDPVRLLRAVRFAAKLGFRLSDEAEKPIHDVAPQLDEVPPARRFEELLKLFHGGTAVETFELLRHYRLFQYVFPLTEISLTREQDGFPLALIPRALANTDNRINNDKPVTPAFLLAVMLWYPMKQKAEEMAANGMSWHEANQFAGQWVIQQQSRATSVPRRFSTPMREIWNLQSRLERRAGKRAFRLLEHPRFRAAYDFLVLRADIGEVETELADWWTVFQEVDESEQRSMVSKLSGGGKKKGRRRRRKADD
ncbi:MAG: poly(A) polymerase [Acidithiobacillales bacterium SG8_45]|nr:MAG: poly(A) polymerase [Acidithiobacillales bacterium SG8_45]